jgi:hypothetical protein
VELGYLRSTQDLGHCWIFKVKRDDSGNLVRFKARLVVRGFEQVEGLDFDKVFSPVVRQNSLRLLLSLATVEDLEIQQLDAKTAFLYGVLEEHKVVCIYPPERTTYPPGTVLRLRKALYGMKQAPRAFTQLLPHISSPWGSEIVSQTCVFVRGVGEDLVYLTVYVDDILVFAKLMREIDLVKERTRQKFEIDDRGSVNFILGIKVSRDMRNKIMTINQHQYTKDLVMWSPGGAFISLMNVMGVSSSTSCQPLLHGG